MEISEIIKQDMNAALLAARNDDLRLMNIYSNRIMSLYEDLSKFGDKRTDERTKLENEIQTTDSEIDKRALLVIVS